MWTLVVSTVIRTSSEDVAPTRSRLKYYEPSAAVRLWARPGVMDGVSLVLRKVSLILLLRQLND